VYTLQDYRFRDEHRFKVFVNTVLRRMCGTKKEKMVGGWGSQHNEELPKLCASPDAIRAMK
jgi:hypothetical protein